MNTPEFFWGLTEKQLRLMFLIVCHALNNEHIFNGLIADGYDNDELEELKACIGGEE